MKCVCKKCGYDWQTLRETKPKSCPKCKSYRWDKSGV